MAKPDNNGRARFLLQKGHPKGGIANILNNKTTFLHIVAELEGNLNLRGLLGGTFTAEMAA